MRLRNRDRFTLETMLSPQVVLGTLRAHCLTRPGQEGGSSRELLFAGDIPYGGTAFVLFPITYGRNSWLPVLSCRLEAKETGGSRLFVDARCRRLVRWIMGIWYGVLVLTTLLVLLSALFGEAQPSQFGGLALAGAVGFFLPHGAFWGPMDRTREALERLLIREPEQWAEPR